MGWSLDFSSKRQIDGKAVGKSSIGFEFSGNFPNKPIRSVGFASVRSFTDMPKSAAEKTHGSLGYRTWIGGKNTREESWKLYSSLNNTDKLIMKGICGLIADENFANDIIDQLEARKPFSFQNWVDNKYNKYFSQSGRHKELVRIGKDCNNRIGNTGNNLISFKIGGPITTAKANNSRNTVQKLCGYPTNYTSNRRLNAVSFG